jgi:tRNA(fMet)-specific endonuclease VapC
MMRYLLDTNVCIEILRGRNSVLKERIAIRSLNEMVICSIVWAELQCGAYLAQNPH